MDIGFATEWMIGVATLSNVLGVIGAAFHVASMSMRTAIPLRITSIASASFLLCAALLSRSLLATVLYGVLIPVHGFRLYQMLGLIKKVQAAVGGDHSLDWLRPYMKRRKYRNGDVLFRKGDEANEMFLIDTGKYRVPEIDVELQPGEIFGELGLLTPGYRRTQSVECVEDGHVLTLPYNEVRALYFENPEFGFYLLRLSSDRLLQGLARAEEALSAERQLHRSGGGMTAPART
jgi:hypothetical protein